MKRFLWNLLVRFSTTSKDPAEQERAVAVMVPAFIILMILIAIMIFCAHQYEQRQLDEQRQRRALFSCIKERLSPTQEAVINDWLPKLENYVCRRSDGQSRKHQSSLHTQSSKTAHGSTKVVRIHQSGRYNDEEVAVVIWADGFSPCLGKRSESSKRPLRVYPLLTICYVSGEKHIEPVFHGENHAKESTRKCYDKQPIATVRVLVCVKSNKRSHRCKEYKIRTK